MTKTIEIIPNVTVTYTVGGKYDRQLHRELAEIEIERELREALRTMDPSDPEYSDIFKDVYGFRPRF